MSGYFIMQTYAEENIKALYSLEEPNSRDGWMLARPFSAPVSTPVQATVNPDNRRGILLPFYGSPQIMRKDLHQALLDAGVDNIDVYEAVVKLEDGTVVSSDYLAYNVLGAVSAADIEGTEFAPENPSRMIDASIEKLQVSDARAKGLLLFRLAESIRLIVVHDKVRRMVEARGIPYMVFKPPSEGGF
jgi:hypothetical protein